MPTFVPVSIFKCCVKLIKTNSKMRIVIIGAGNVATHIALALGQAGMPPVKIWSRTMESAQVLAERVGCLATTL